MRICYADPPYPGRAHLYREHPDFAGEVDHRTLIDDLQQYDGWTQLDAKTPDSRRYSALGDAVTANVAEWIGRRILEAA